MEHNLGPMGSFIPRGTFTNGEDKNYKHTVNENAVLALKELSTKGDMYIVRVRGQENEWILSASPASFFSTTTVFQEELVLHYKDTNIMAMEYHVLPDIPGKSDMGEGPQTTMDFMGKVRNMEITKGSR